MIESNVSFKGGHMNNNKKKIGLFGCIFLAIGSIIGSGIFGTLPAGINSIGSSVVIAFIFAALYVIALLIPDAYSMSIIPKSGGAFLYSAKLISPYVGLFMVYLGLVHPLLIASFAKMFATYFIALFPALAPYATVCGVAILVVFFVLAYFGNDIFAKFSTAMVFVLLGAIAVYVILGLPHMDVSKLAVSEVMGTGASLTTLSATIVMVSSTLNGAGNVAQIADDLKNPSRDIPLTLIIAPLSVSFIYILMAIVTVGVMPGATIETLSDVAAAYLSPALLTFFIVGGPLFGILTSLIPVIMMSNAILYSAAENKVFPDFTAKKNKFGTPVVMLCYVIGVAILLIATKVSYGVLMTVFSLIVGLSSIPKCLVPFFLRRRYPHACKHPGLKLNPVFITIVCIFAIIVDVYLSISTIISLGASAWIAFAVILAVSLIYLYFRIRKLKGDGYDLIRELGSPYPEWEALEAKWTQVDNASAGQ